MGLGFAIRNVEIDWRNRPSWSYSGFNRFRSQIAGVVGLRELKDWYDLGLRPFPELPKEEPLRDFFEHSDCDGALSPEQLRVIRPALLDAVEKLPRSSDQIESYDFNMGSLLCELMRIAIEHNEPLEFC